MSYAPIGPTLVYLHVTSSPFCPWFSGQPYVLAGKYDRHAVDWSAAYFDILTERLSGVQNEYLMTGLLMLPRKPNMECVHRKNNLPLKVEQHSEVYDNRNHAGIFLNSLYPFMLVGHSTGNKSGGLWKRNDYERSIMGLWHKIKTNFYFDGSVQDCSNSTANAMELLHPCT